jgi:hypothetical protein
MHAAHLHRMAVSQPRHQNVVIVQHVHLLLWKKLCALHVKTDLTSPHIGVAQLTQDLCGNMRWVFRVQVAGTKRVTPTCWANWWKVLQLLFGRDLQSPWSIRMMIR